MNVPQLQSQLALNRCFLSSFHHDLSIAKRELKSNCERDMVPYWRHEMKFSRKQIARLAKLQKSLKADLATLVQVSRVSRKFWRISDGSTY